MSRDDDSLMFAFQKGETGAFTELVERYQDRLLRYFRHRGRSVQESEDDAQEVWRKIFRSRSEYTAKALFSTYFYRIARNLLIDRLRSAAHKHPAISLDDGGAEDDGFERRAAAVDLLAAAGPDPSDEMSAGELRERIRAAIDQLPEAQREAFMLSQFDGLPYEEIASVLGVPVGTVKSRMFNAVRRLREALRTEVS